VESGAKTDRAQLRRLLGQVDAGDVLLTRLNRLARLTLDLLAPAHVIRYPNLARSYDVSVSTFSVGKMKLSAGASTFVAE
jgi:hypothetical protein